MGNVGENALLPSPVIQIHKDFRLFLQNIFIFFHSCMIHSNSSCSKEYITIDDVCTFYVKYMWQLIGGCEATSESWTLTGSDIM